MRHCDSYIHDLSQPLCLRFWLLVHRLPAADMELLNRAGVNPDLFASTVQGRTVRLVMASRLGDVGITGALTDLTDDRYEQRVHLDLLCNFRDHP
jgi:hypothetical protein